MKCGTLLNNVFPRIQSWKVFDRSNKNLSIADSINKSVCKLDYFIGSFWAKKLLRSVGGRCQIHRSVKYWNPSKIIIEDDCEIRHGVFLDARSQEEVGIKIGSQSRIKDYVGVAAYGGQIILGNNVLVGRCCTIFGHGDIFIDRYTMLAPNVSVLSSNHLTALNGKPFQEQGEVCRSVHIQENVWIGANVTILAGSIIESNVVVAAGAVVTGYLKSGCLYAGVPAKLIKELSSEERGQELKIRLRNWDLYD